MNNVLQLSEKLKSFSKEDLITELIGALCRAGELAEAIKPFAAAADDLADGAFDHDNLWESPAAMNLTAGDLRKASAITNKEHDHGPSSPRC